jgi:CCR4-NOT transcriptional regulation complex NOT5 subunit|tara:strand:- start:49 stop:261 length:213 start_codon:yes stop_codon:yes gene_type:complete
MALRDEVKDWLSEGKDIKVKSPLCSKRLVIENLNELLECLENDWRDMAKGKIKSLINDIENTDKLDAGKL